MSETTITPPERCPVCGTERKEEDFQFNNGTWSREYHCGAEWRSQSRNSTRPHFYHPCPHAMTAALRCDATLAPSPLELARDALVAAAVDRYEANAILNDVLDDETADGDMVEPLMDAWHKAQLAEDLAITMYLAAAQPPQPDAEPVPGGDKRGLA